MKYLLAFFLFLFITTSFAQQKKQLEHSDFDSWKKIAAQSISSNGLWISYELRPGFGDPDLVITNDKGVNAIQYHRGYGAKFNQENTFMVFLIKPQLDSLNKLRRNKVKEDELLKDSIGIFNLSAKNLLKFPSVKSYKLPEKWGTHLAYQTFPVNREKEQKKDSTKSDEKQNKSKKLKKQNDKNGYNLVVRDLLIGKQDTFPFVKEYVFSETGKKLIFTSTGNDSTFYAGVYVLNIENNKLLALCRGKGEYKNISLNKTGNQAAFLADRDTSKERIRSYELFFWKEENDSAKILANNQSAFLPDNWFISENGKISFSENSKYLFFGSSPIPVLQDTLLLPEEIVNVEVWNYQDKRLYTQQNAELKEDLKKGYSCAYIIDKNEFFQLSDTIIDVIRYSDKSNSEWTLGISENQYKHLTSWEGSPDHYDIYKLNLNSGRKELIVRDIRASMVNISPGGKYIYWFSAMDSAWYVHQNQSGKTIKAIDFSTTKLTDELNDIPNYPEPYGLAGWMKNDSLVFVYDRYDLWLVDPNGIIPPEKITSGRPAKTVFRYIRLEKDDPYIDAAKKQLLESFDETNKQDGYYELTLKKKSLKKLISGEFRFQNLVKAEKSEKIIFTKENFTVFPDLQSTDLSFKKINQISHANPQQKAYLWGTAELYKWKSADGIDLEGILYKPANFDSTKKYPLLVNFYERYSDNLYRHIIPEPHRSTINYSFYTSRGYLIFVPDIVYKIGYPGESCYISVIPGVKSLVEKGFVDEKHIGVQGHSWGAYQIAYLLTRTDIFAAAEAGAPVPNMISAYGGIRWQTGLSRMFQYEHGQSRIGLNLWEDREKYINNSPIFFLDKVNTPLLLMHNDNDGHVPWYQGIEYFVSMRRLGKPVWMINYNGEPHWPLKWQNQKDFNIRMQQFFDHFLKGAPIPEWMEKGIPATLKGIKSGYDL